MRSSLFGPFARDEMLMLPGFDDATPVCPAEAVDGVREWVPAAQIPDFKELFLDAAAPDDGPGAAAFKGAALQKALAMGVPPTAYMISESRKRIADLEKALKAELQRRETRDAQFDRMLASIQELAASMGSAVERLDDIRSAIEGLPAAPKDPGVQAPEEPLAEAKAESPPPPGTPEPPASPTGDILIPSPPLEGPEPDAEEPFTIDAPPPAAPLAEEVLEPSPPEIPAPETEEVPFPGAAAVEIDAESVDAQAKEAASPLEDALQAGLEPVPAEDAAAPPEAPAVDLDAPEEIPELETAPLEAPAVDLDAIPAEEADPPLDAPAEELIAPADTPVFDPPAEEPVPDAPAPDMDAPTGAEPPIPGASPQDDDAPSPIEDLMGPPDEET